MDDNYRCSMEDYENPFPSMTIRASDPRRAASFYKLEVSSKGGKPGNIVVSYQQERMLFSWELKELHR